MAINVVPGLLRFVALLAGSGHDTIFPEWTAKQPAGDSKRTVLSPPARDGAAIRSG